MGFLDNLESSLKSLEASDERDPNEAARRQADRSRSVSIRPWADKLKNSDYTKQLFDRAALAGHKIRAKIYIAWLEDSLRLEARGRILELKPTTEGVVAQYTQQDGTPVLHPVDLESDPATLLDEWLSGEQPPSNRTTEGVENSNV